MEPIRVPRPPQTSFNRNRPVSDLLQAQIKHFQHLESKLPDESRSPYAPHELSTESAAAQYIAHMTRVLCDSGRDEFVVGEPQAREKKSKQPKAGGKIRQSRSKRKTASKREANSESGSKREAKKKATKRASEEKTKSTHSKRKRAEKP
jgi:hypothetical protein